MLLGKGIENLSEDEVRRFNQLVLKSIYWDEMAVSLRVFVVNLETGEILEKEISEGRIGDILGTWVDPDGISVLRN